MKIAICDDMVTDRAILKKTLYRLEQELNVEFAVSEYETASQLIAAYQQGVRMQVLFLDVYIGDELGTDTAFRMRELGYEDSIIFCTTSEDFALDGFRVHADGYIVKPYEYQEFKQAIARIIPLLAVEQRRVCFNSERIEYEIPQAEITHIESYNKGCQVYTKKEMLFTWKKLKEFSEELTSANFYHVGRYSLVNLDAIAQVEDDDLVMTDGTTVQLPVRDQRKIKQDINDYIWEKMRQ